MEAGAKECAQRGEESNQGSSLNIKSNPRSSDQSTNMLNIISMPLNGENYFSRATAADLFFSGRSKLGFINSSIKYPNKDGRNQEWESDKDLVMS
ncbi:hypothetical protein EJ110_NYTH19082 [Nymphaea thermarum]|nr:hypothetical protein EJ110_NYTH19082 [Nymphaea thermarum]